ncbi:diaminobutyrate acetyltransferase [Thiomicrospira microaerophila]|uniref:diaminobutyrate acetyltransferase n=1 Tax=Thiomicrospira microaerophila TaxID=406020 RepID=UPI00200DB82A|nr:diaminobutyrate acetyltransferase [Thiomicrospira microaerophila]UQB41314.1 diaminobutyrate acetyltransferase [Thiomicrospira microaerophila]
MNITIRPPCLKDGAAITRLVKESQTLDVNSSYLYFLLSDHFSQTCAIAEVNNRAVGFVTAYRLPDNPDVLFVWQVAVDPAMRGQGLAMRLLQNLAARDWFDQIRKVQCTISPSNQASNALFFKWANSLGAELQITDYLTTDHLGDGHEAEPLVSFSIHR